MNIPTTLAELRANVAELESDNTFVGQHPRCCLVTLPLNSAHEDNPYAYFPGTNDFEMRGTYTTMSLADEISAAANAWDAELNVLDTQTRDEALAWIDRYIGTLEGETA